MLAEKAEERNGTLDITGGGWDTLTQHEPLPPEAPDEAVAVLTGTVVIRLLFHVTETDRQHTFKLTIMDADGNMVGGAEGGINVAHHPSQPVGWDQAVPMVIPLPDMPLPRWGRYTISLQVNDHHTGDRAFRVVKGYEEDGQ